MGLARISRKWPGKKAIGKRHRVFLRVSGSCVKVSAESQFPKRLERSEAVERLELLELASSFCESDLFTSKKRALSLQTALFIQSSIDKSIGCPGPTRQRPPTPLHFRRKRIT